MEWLQLAWLSIGVVLIVMTPLYLGAILASSSTFAWKGVRLLKWAEPTFALIAGIPMVLFGAVIHQTIDTQFSLAVVFFSLMCSISIFQLLFEATLSARSQIFDAFVVNGAGRWKSTFHGVFRPSLASALDAFRLHLPHAVLAILLSQWLKGEGIGGLLRSSNLLSATDRWGLAVTIALGLFVIDAVLSRFAVAPTQKGTLAGVPVRDGQQVTTLGALPHASDGQISSRSLGILARLTAVVAFFVGWSLLAIFIDSSWVFKDPVTAFRTFSSDPHLGFCEAGLETTRATILGAFVGFCVGSTAGAIGYVTSAISEQAHFTSSVLPKLIRSAFSVTIFFAQSVPILVWLRPIEQAVGTSSISVAVAGIVVGSRVFQFACRADSFLPKALTDSLHVNAVSFWRRCLMVDRYTVIRSIVLGLDGALPLAVSGVLIGEFFVSGTGLGGEAHKTMALHHEVPLIVITICAFLSMITREMFLFVARRVNV